MSVDFAQVRRLYQQNRFLDAFNHTEMLWNDPASLDKLSAEELAMARRLAFAIGGFRTSRWISQQAARRFGDHPLFRGHWGRRNRRKNFLDCLRDFYRHPQLNSGIAEYDCQWLCDHAEMLAMVRDFREAGRILELAHNAHSCPDVEASRATILLRQDRLEDALAVARDVWKAQPGRPAAARLLSGVLARQGRLDEILDVLEPHALHGQSFEIAVLMCWHLCARAERSDASHYKDYARRAADLSLRLPSLSPLADRDTAIAIATARADCALILGDRATMLESAGKIPGGFFKHVVQNLQANPDGRFTLAPYRQVYQKHSTCLPSSIAAVAGAFGHEIDSDALASAVSYDGTSTWRAVDWLESHGYATRTFVGHGQTWRALLDAGIPFVLMDLRMSFSHAVAVIGYDDAQGTLIVHDPSSERWSQAMLEGLEKSAAPFGPECLAIVPADRSAALNCIPPESCRGITTLNNCLKELRISGHQACRPLVDRLCSTDPSGAFSRRMQALQAAWEGDLFQAIKGQEGLLREFPDSTALQLDLLASLARTRDTARIVQVQAEIVERGRLPGIQQNQPWRLPPSPFVAQYADYIGQHLEGMKKAVRLLNRSILYEPCTAQLYQTLADVLLRHGLFDEALLPCRVAASLEATNDRCARTLCDTLRHLGREQEGIEFLQWRVEEWGSRLYGAHPWICLIDALEDFGRPDEAIAAMQQAQVAHPRDVHIQAHASQFWVRMGRWDAAAEALEVARQTPGPVYLAAAVDFHRAKGQWPEALPLCEQWVTQEPANIFARRSLIGLIRSRDGSLATVRLAQSWRDEYKNDELFEQLYYDVLGQVDDSAKMQEHLRQRVAHNPLDAWAWRQLGFQLIRQVGQAPPAERPSLMAELDRALLTAKQLSGDCAPVYGVEGDKLSIRGEFAQAMESFFKAIEIDAGYSYSYRRLWSLAARLPVDEQRQVLVRLEGCLLRQTGQLFDAGPLSLAIADRLGIVDAEAAVTWWLNQRPDDPEIIAAQADLWLSYGRGQTDARRAVTTLIAALERFVNHSGLRFLLARAHAVLLQDAEQSQAFEEILRRQPLNVQARYSLAMALARSGQADKAVALVEEGRAFSPDSSDAYEALADVLEFVGRSESSLEVILAATQRIPERMSLWERAIRLMQQLGRFDDAVGLSRKLMDLFPNGAYVWYLHAVALSRGPTGSDFIAMERALHQSLRLNAGLWSAACRLSDLLMYQNRFADAQAVIEEQMPLFEDVSYHRAQLARILWAQGNRSGAIDAMAAMLLMCPKISWGWNELLDWLDQEKDWPTVKRVLKTIPPVMASNADFRARRLLVLKKAGWKDQDLDDLWQALLDDFPGNEDIHLYRVDMLWDRARVEEAKRILEHVGRLHPNSEFVAARRVHVVALDNPPEALRRAMAIWTNTREASSWPAAHAWEAIAKSNVAGQAVHELYDWLAQGKPIGRSAIDGLLKHIHRAQFKRGFWDYVSLSRLMPSVQARMRALRTLMDVLEAHPWDDGYCRAQVLVALWQTSPSDAWQYFRTHPSCHQQTPVWSEGCRIFISSARQWLAKWPEHKDVQMYTVANYTLAIRGIRKRRRLNRNDLRELANSAEKALASLVHDSNARYLACTLCEAELRLGRNEDFLTHMQQLQGLIQNQDERFWMTGSTHLPKLLTHFETLLRAETPEQCHAATESFRTSILRTPWATGLWRRLLRSRVGFWSWLAHAIWLS